MFPGRMVEGEANGSNRDRLADSGKEDVSNSTLRGTKYETPRFRRAFRSTTVPIFSFEVLVAVSARLRSTISQLISENPPFQDSTVTATIRIGLIIPLSRLASGKVFMRYGALAAVRLRLLLEGTILLAFVGHEFRVRIVLPRASHCVRTGANSSPQPAESAGSTVPLLPPFAWPVRMLP